MDDKQKEPYQVERTGFHDSAWYRLFDVLLNSEKSINNKVANDKHGVHKKNDGCNATGLFTRTRSKTQADSRHRRDA
ncbi:hypothetical protein COY62_04130 [bacterium (Candidatus Howlettbacteria) CG_4_10_14_0_8_um_filter_40_9]|nr:MAG: hypothetical protein COY62_04130 [bacterium (Candidatus Howlettbacteria) CG_4_10_14_0_8_um_filter_40_9]